MNSLPQRQTQAIEYFNLLPTWCDRFNYLIKLGEELPAMPPSLITPGNRFGGCQSVTYVAVEVVNGRVYIHGKSNAAIPKGIIALAHNIFNSCLLNELEEIEVNFHSATNLQMQLTHGRQNFLASLVHQICGVKELSFCSGAL